MQIIRTDSLGPGRRLGLLLVAGLAMVTVACAIPETESTATSAGRISTSNSHTVTYKVEGSTTLADITYSNSQGDTTQQSDVKVPLRREDSSTWSQPDGGFGVRLSGMQSGDFLYISAQNGRDSGSITCKIEVDGIVVKTNTSLGGYTIATCSGSL